MTWNFADFHFNNQHWDVSFVAAATATAAELHSVRIAIAKLSETKLILISLAAWECRIISSWVFFLLLNCLYVAYIVSKTICNINWNIFLVARMANRRSATQLHSLRVADYWVWEMHAKFTRFSHQNQRWYHKPCVVRSRLSSHEYSWDDSFHTHFNRSSSLFDTNRYCDSNDGDDVQAKWVPIMAQYIESLHTSFVTRAHERERAGKIFIK